MLLNADEISKKLGLEGSRVFDSNKPKSHSRHGSIGDKDNGIVPRRSIKAEKKEEQVSNSRPKGFSAL